MTGLEIAALISTIAAGTRTALSGSGGRSAALNRRPLGRIGGLELEDLFRRGIGNIEHLGGVATARAAQPTTLPSAYVQPLPQYLGPHVSLGLPGMDPALVRPSLQGAPGIRFGEPETAKKALEFPSGDPEALAYSQGRGVESYLFPGAPRERGVKSEVTAYQDAGEPLPSQQGLRQWGPPMPQEEMGKDGGFTELGSALQLLGVETDPYGRLTMGRNLPLFTGAGSTYRPSEPTTPYVKPPVGPGDMPGSNVGSTDYYGNPVGPAGGPDTSDWENWDTTPQTDEHGNIISEFGGPDSSVRPRHGSSVWTATSGSDMPGGQPDPLTTTWTGIGRGAKGAYNWMRGRGSKEQVG